MLWKRFSLRNLLVTSAVVFTICVIYIIYDRTGGKQSARPYRRRTFAYRQTLAENEKSSEIRLSNQKHSGDSLQSLEHDVDFLIPSDDVLQQLDEEDLMRIYWRYINNIHILCRNQFRFGSLGDGGKEVCLDPDYRPAKPCIVYSFGSNFQFGFDLTAHNFLGCDVYTFDPSMETRGPRQQQPIPKELNFHQIGLAGHDHVTDTFWEMKTLQTIMRENGHENKIIDILKIDIEGDEWTSVPNILETGIYKQIKQLLIEVHVGHMFMDPNRPFWGHVDLTKQLRVLRLLYDHGFRIFMRDRVLGSQLRLHAPPQHVITTQNEISLINIAFLDNGAL